MFINYFLKKAKIFLFIIFIFGNNVLATAQKIDLDSLIEVSYNELNLIRKNEQLNNSQKVLKIQDYIKSAKNNNDTIRIAEAYYFLSIYNEYSEYEKAHLYIDSMIRVTAHFKSRNEYPSRSLIKKGNLYFSKGDFNSALDSYLKGLVIAKENNNYLNELALRSNIGLIKEKLGEYEEALIIHKDYIKFLNSTDEFILNRERLLMHAYLILGNCYIANENYDSSKIALKYGINKYIKNRDSEIYARYLAIYGRCLFYAGDYTSSIDTMKKAITIQQFNHLLTTAYFFIGKSYKELNNFNEAIKYFSKVDSVLSIVKNNEPRFIEIYKPLIDYYAKEKNYKKQLYYTNALIRYDSIKDATNQYLSKTLTNKYTIEELLKSKKELEERLDKASTQNKLGVIVLFLISFVIISITIFFLNRIKKLKKEANGNRVEIKDVLSIKNKSTELSQEVKESILKKLKQFEKSEKFIKNKYTLSVLASELNSNSAYLSKVVNDNYSKNFSQYLNDLRVNYTVKKLKESKQFRSFKIKAIAEEVGFSNSQSFSSAFQKITGLYPSEFIKKIQNEEC